MIECRHCREVFRSSPEKLGARCPNCRLPLFERLDRLRTEAVEVGVFCAAHAEVEALGRCARCGQRVCAVCRMRWYDEALCPACADLALSAGEPGPRELAQRERLAQGSLVLALVGWGILLFTLIPWWQLQSGTGGIGAARATGILFFGSLVPALLALGQAAFALRMRVQRLAAAAGGFVLGGLHIGLMVGVLLINLWHN